MDVPADGALMRRQAAYSRGLPAIVPIEYTLPAGLAPALHSNGPVSRVEV